MQEISLNILDIMQNSVSAEAKNIKLAILAKDNLLSVTIEDNGKGMDKEMLDKVTDPFTTSRTTRKIGMGIPLFKQSAEYAGGEFCIESEVGVGTTVKATFQMGHIDKVPLGDISETLIALILTAPHIDYELDYTVENKSFQFDTKAVKETLEGLPIDSIEVIAFLREYLTQNILEINGGISL